MSKSKNSRFSNVVKNKNNKKESISNNSSIELSNAGWTILTKNKITNTNKKEIVHLKESDELKKNLKVKEFRNGLNQMVEHWNNFRDAENELRGYLSLYINYKNELEELMIEDRYIAELLYEENKIDSCDNNEYYSDEEANKHLIY